MEGCWPNNVLQKTNTAVANSSVFLSRHGLLLRQVWLPVVRGGVGF